MNCFHHCGTCKTRADISILLNRLFPKGVGVEVGVHRGRYSEVLLKQWNCKKFYLVDPWRKLEDYQDTRNEQYSSKDYEFVLSYFSKYEDRVQLCRNTSEEAARLLPNDLDFVYIDANHAYEFVHKDLRTWWNKLRQGGMLAGHDVLSHSYPGVTVALVEFCLELNVIAYLIWGDYDSHGKCLYASSWYIFKK